MYYICIYMHELNLKFVQTNKSHRTLMIYKSVHLDDLKYADKTSEA